MPGPLDGIRILDLTTVFLGPYCTQILGDMGADIVKVEPPTGDTTRYLGPARNHGMSGTFLNVNRNKRSCVLDLKAQGAMDVLARLVKTADVVVHNMRPQAAERLGLTYEWLKSQRSDIIFCGAFGYGEGGRYAGRPAFDDIIQASSGIAAYQGMLSGEPGYCGTVVADKVTGMAAANAVLGALIARERTGLGQKVEVPMYETMVSFVLAEHMFGAAFEPPLSPPVYTRVVSQNRRPYPTQDGHLTVVPYTDRQWRNFFTTAGREDLADDPRFTDMTARTANINALYELLSALLTEQTTQEWITRLESADVPHVEVKSPEQIMSDPHLEDVGFYRCANHPTEGRIRMTMPATSYSETAQDIRILAPSLGEHTADILSEAGFSQHEIEALRSSGATRPTSETS